MNILDKISASGQFFEIDLHFSKLISRLANVDSDELALAAALVSNHIQRRHICVDLAAVAGEPLNENGGIICPSLNPWLDHLNSSNVVGRPGDKKPLILDRGRLYLCRYWEYEDKLANSLIERALDDCQDFNPAILHDGLIRLFPHRGASEIDWQKLAAFGAFARKLCIITGGPGTGKTTTVGKILALMLEQNRALRIALAAPTGKACARLQESIRSVRQSLDSPDEIKKLLPDKAATLHRLLGYLPNSPYFRHNKEKPLPYDVAVIDEASMVDLPMMSKLVEALPSTSRLILLGDKDQLASVEAGAVLGDICGRSRPRRYSTEFSKRCHEMTGYELEANDGRFPISDCVFELRQNFRFGPETGIGTISALINRGLVDESLGLLTKSGFPDITLLALPHVSSLESVLRDGIMVGYGGYLDHAEVSAALAAFDSFRILCAVRDGPYGVVALNRMVERVLASENVIKPESQWYHGRPIMVTKNDYNLKLYNGDVGIMMRDQETGGTRAFFAEADERKRAFPPVRLPDHETVYAMTVHKSQGSEFDEIVLILPDVDSPVVTRELIYTAITRARRSVVILANEDLLRSGAKRITMRTSGLEDRLWASAIPG